MYTAYFGFREKPFNVTPDPRFFYTNPVYEEAYASLVYGIRERKGFVVLTGEVGTGKTTLLHRLMHNLEATVRFVYFYNTTLSFEELLSFTCAELRLPVQGGGRLEQIQALNEFLIAQLKRGGTGVLLIDEAQNLGDEVLEQLRLLSNLETPREKLLQIVLVGQPELERKLAQPNLRQLKQRVALQRRLDRLKDREVGAYIRYRLRTVGYERRDLFTPAALRRIALYSRGIPRLINIICDNALVIVYGTSRKAVSAEMVEEVAADLRLTEVEAATMEVQPATLAANNGHEADVEAAGDGLVTSRWRRMGWVGIASLLGLLILGGAGAVIYSQHTAEQFANLSHTLRGDRRDGRGRLAFVKPEPEPGLGAVRSGEARPEKVPPLVGSELPPVPGSPPAGQPAAQPDGQSLTPDPVPEKAVGKQESAGEVKGGSGRERAIVIPHGATIYDLISGVYGAHRILALDLLQELNPHIGDLNKVRGGQQLLLPSFTRDTLLHRQPDGSYHLLLASFRSLARAEKFAQDIRLRGYSVVISPRQVAETFSLYRVGIGELNDLATVNRAWETALANRWVPSGDNPPPKNPQWAPQKP